MKSFKRIASRLREHWQNLMNSEHRKMSRGAENIDKIITSAHGEQWRRHDVKKKSTKH